MQGLSRLGDPPWVPAGLLDALQGIDDLPSLTTREFVGIMVAISGNVLISLALNLQKLAHKKVEKMRSDTNDGKPQSESSGIVSIGIIEDHD